MPARDAGRSPERALELALAHYERSISDSARVEDRVSRVVNYSRSEADGLLLEDGSGALLLEDGGRILLEVSAPAGGWLAPRPLTPEEHGIVFLLAQLGAMYASMTGASAELTVEIGLVVFLAAREFTRRVL